MTRNKWKGLVKKVIQTANTKELKSDMSSYRKLDNSELLLEDFGRQPYLKQLNLSDSQTKFKYRTKMTQYVKMNYLSENKNTPKTCGGAICVEQRLILKIMYSGALVMPD
jgi:hypothetical protein